MLHFADGTPYMHVLDYYESRYNNMPQETFTVTSGREFTVDYDTNGEPLNISWMAGTQLVMLSENEVFEIYEFITDEEDIEVDSR